ncbi:hypothetical protein [Bifidobacterium animalis]|uniref:hypothetical protein n=1 Tax=Bifidobacterium animalis TaxID=28025 RepID=UPI0012D75BE5|nr:hypothetical protein [Bifidobacterium animalis]
MNPHQRNEFISWTALGLLAHDVYAFQMPEGISFGFMLREALRESGAPYNFDLNTDPDKIIEQSVSHPRYQIWNARWDKFIDDDRKWCFEVYFIASVDQDAFEAGGSGLRLVAEIFHEDPETIKKTSLYRFGELMTQKLKANNYLMYTYRKE